MGIKETHFGHKPHGIGWGGVGVMTFFCTCTHVRFYTLATHHMGWGGGGDADVLLHLHTCEILHFGHTSHGMGWGGVLTFFCTCTHVRFYTLGTHHMGWGGEG